ncbi:MAG: betaine--homocysteine S-methyltransferase [Ardenticatenaceae bacterium]
MNQLQTLLKSEQTLLLDGATGTILMDRGLESGDPPEEWNVLYPDNIRWLYRQYIDAGSRIILTNSFGGTGFRLKLHKLQDRVTEFNRAAAALARAEADAASQPVIVAGSIGPSGELLDPLGSLTFEGAKAGFAEQATALAEGGADLIWIETMSDLNEVKAAVEGARSVCNLPIAATLSFDTVGRSMMGVTGQQAAKTLGSWGLAALGANCGNNLSDTEKVIRQMHAVDPNQVLICKANAGIPEWKNGEQSYNGTPEVMAQYALRVRAMGAKLIGACCGSTPEHIRAMAEALAKPIEDQPTNHNNEAASANVTANGDEPPTEKQPRRRRRRRRR